MDLMRRHEVVLFMVTLSMLLLCRFTNANFVFKVQHKFERQQELLRRQQQQQHRNLSAYKAHDSRRHSRLLLAVDLPLGGNGNPSEAGLYYAKLGIGTPSKDYYVQVDTGSDILWVNCITCNKCPTKSDLGVMLTLYDPSSSSTAKQVYCNDNFCTSTFNSLIPDCTSQVPCQYNVVYGDGSSTAGYFVKDTVHFDSASGNMQTSPANGNVIFGCGAQQSGELDSTSEALDGILGFGQSNSSMISQLASAGTVKKIFSHCLDSINGGGIFAIGEVVSPKFNTTPIVPNQSHYNVVLESIDVGGSNLSLPSGLFDTGDKKGTIVDSGTTLAYLPEVAYEAVMSKILAQQPTLALHTVEDQFSCFKYTGNVDNGFPVVNFHFQGSLTLKVYPHDYLFQISDVVWCFGWQSSGSQSKDGQDMTLLGDLVLSNKLVIYDLENQVIGWTDYNCSSSIQVKDETSGSVYSIGAHSLSSASNLIWERCLAILLLLFSLSYRFT